jgi:predicted ATPase
VTDILEAARAVRILATSRVRLNVGGEHRYPVPGMRVPDLETQEKKRENVAPPLRSAQEAAHYVFSAQEALYPVRSAKEAARYGAIKLFLQGARRAEPGFELTEDNLGSVVRICRSVEGMPLAIRLAAPWVALLSPDEIASELARDVDLLTTDRRDVPARQRSVRATLDYSWRLVGG